MNILLVGNDWSAFAPLTERFSREGNVRLVYVGSGDAALDQLRATGEKTVDLVIAGGHLSDMAGIRFVRQAVSVNPLVHTAVVGSLSDAAFHEATEGLGVLLQLPPQPSERDAENLLSQLRKISVLMHPDATGEESSR